MQKGGGVCVCVCVCGGCEGGGREGGGRGERLGKAAFYATLY